MFSDNDLEWCQDISEEETKMEDYVINKLKDPKATYRPSFNLSAMQFRCRFNTQRNLQLWAIKTDEKINEDFLISAFEDTPDEIKSLIKEKGVQFA